MARIRNPSASSAANPRKRSRESASPSRSPKRRQNLGLETDAPNLSFSRENSPSKNVHWGRGSRIISGPSIFDPERRSHSPTRSALRRSAHEDYGGSEDERHEANAQLQDELCRADMSPSPAKRSSKQANNPSANVASRETNAQASSRTRGDDEDICTHMDAPKERIRQFANGLPFTLQKAKSDVLSHILQPQNEQLVRYIGCISMGGGKGEQSWKELLTDHASRKAMFWGVMGKALKENIFDELYFGAWPELEARVRRMEQQHATQDGFFRQRARSNEIAKAEAGFSRTQNERLFQRAAASVTLGLESLLLPLWSVGAHGKTPSQMSSDARTALFDIVVAAADIARDMRKAHDVIYYWPPTFKDEEFEPARMECLNLNDMIHHSPYDRQQIDGRDRPVLREGQANRSQAIVRVVCFPGIQAYRQGGGELAKNQLAAERTGVGRGADAVNAPPDVLAVRRKVAVTNRYGEEYTGDEGIRTRVISKGVVLLKWGQQRLLTKEAGTSVHMDAVKAGDLRKYEKDMAGHVELYKLFQEKMVSTAKAEETQQQQRSPSLMQSFVAPFGFWPFLGNGAEDPISRPHQVNSRREAVVVPVNPPRGKKTSWR